MAEFGVYDRQIEAAALFLESRGAHLPDGHDAIVNVVRDEIDNNGGLSENDLRDKLNMNDQAARAVSTSSDGSSNYFSLTTSDAWIACDGAVEWYAFVRANSDRFSSSYQYALGAMPNRCGVRVGGR